MHRRPRFPAGPNLAGLFTGRGKIHAHRHLQMRDGYDLEYAISNMRVAVALAKKTQLAMLGPALGNLAALLLEQFKSTGRHAVLNEALQFARWALDCLPTRDHDSAVVLVTLGTILTYQYDCSMKTQDLEEAIVSLQVSAQSRGSSGDGALSAVISNNIVCVMEKRYNSTGRRQDLSAAINAALQATKVEFPNNSSLVVGMYLNLASLLTRQFETTGKFDSLTDALFEIRIATKVAPESKGLDAILGHLYGLAKEQHALRVQPTDERIEVSQLIPSKHVTLLITLSASLALFIPSSLVLHLLIAFFGGIIIDWGVRTYRSISGDNRLRSLLQSTPTRIQRILSPYDHSSFASTLHSTPWIDSGSEEGPYRNEMLRMPIPTRTTPFDSKRDEGWRTKAMIQSLARNRDRIQDNLDPIHLEFNQTPHTPPFRPNLFAPAPSRVVGIYEDSLEIPKLPLYDHSVGSEGWHDDLGDSLSDGEQLGISLAIPKVRRESTHTDDPSECASNLFREALETQETIPDTIGVSRSCPSRQIATEATTLDKYHDRDDIPTSTKNFPTDDGPESLDKPSPTAFTPLIATKETPTSSSQTRSEKPLKSIEDTHKSLGEEFIDQKVHTRTPPTKIEKESSAFDSVGQGNTTNDMNKNEGNAMGNIYSEEANVVGHLSRHYGDIYETKNIYAVLRESQNLDLRVSQDLQEATMSKAYTENIPQEVLDEYIRDLVNLPAEHQRGGAQKAPRDRKPGHGPGGIPNSSGRNRFNFDSQSRTAKYAFRDLTKEVAKKGASAVGKLDHDTWSLFNDEIHPSKKFDAEEWSGAFTSKYFSFDLNRHSPDQKVKPTSSSSGKTVASSRQGNTPKSAAQPRFDHVDIPRQHDFEEIRRPTSTVVGQSGINEQEPGGYWVEDHVGRRDSPKDGERTHKNSDHDANGGQVTGLSEGVPQDSSSEDVSVVYKGRRVRISRSMNRENLKRATTDKDGLSTGEEVGTETRIIRRARTGYRRSGSDKPPHAPRIKDIDNTRDQVQALWSYFRGVLKPLCDNFNANPPANPRIQEEEYNMLSEYLLAQVLLQADSIGPEGNEAIRRLRRRLIKEAQAVLHSLDAHRTEV